MLGARFSVIYIVTVPAVSCFDDILFSVQVIVREYVGAVLKSNSGCSLTYRPYSGKRKNQVIKVVIITDLGQRQNQQKMLKI